MPTYNYVCQQCGDTEEVFHSMTATVRIICEKCNVDKIRKPATTAISFTGGGWASKE